MRRLLAGLLMGIVLPAAAAPRAITIENNTDGVLRGVYATETGDDNWRADRLQENIQVGATATIPLPTAACHYDFRVLLESRPDELLFMDVDVCKASSLTVDSDHGRPLTREAK